MNNYEELESHIATICYHLLPFATQAFRYFIDLFRTWSELRKQVAIGQARQLRSALDQILEKAMATRGVYGGFTIW